MTERKQSRSRPAQGDDRVVPLAQEAEREWLRHAHEITGLISWRWDALTDSVERPYGAALGSATGIRQGATLGAVLSHVDAPYRAGVKLALEGVVAGDDACVLRYPLVGSRLEAVWVETRASMPPPESGPPMLRLSTQDITELWRARDELDAGRVFWQATLDSLPDHVAVLAAGGEIVAVNEAWSEFARAQGGHEVGVGANYLLACDTAGASGDADAVQVAARLRAMLRGDEGQFGFEYLCTTPQGDRWFALRASRFRGSGPDRVVVQHEDITQATRARADIQTQARLLDAVDASVIASDLEGRVTHWNEGAERLYGWSAAEAVGQDITSLVVGERELEAARQIQQATEEHGHSEAELDLRDKAGAIFPVYVRSAVLVGEHGDPIGRVSVSVDISERVEGRRRLRSAESYLRAVTDSMGEGLMTVDGNGQLTYLNYAGEEMLGWPRSAVARQHAHTIIHDAPSHGSPFPPSEGATSHDPAHPPVVRVDDGVFACRDGTSLSVSYTASPFASSEGDAGWVVVFSDITARKAEQVRIRRELDALSWVSRIRTALSSDGLCLVAQPIVEIDGGRVVQHELLLRMRGERGKTILPGEFLPAAEASGLIGEIDRWVLMQGLGIARAGHAVEINLSAASLGAPDLLAFVREQLTRTGADPNLVVFELTETAVLQNEGAAQAFIERVSLLGCRVALDDFGSGYGGFRYLKRLPVHFLKIDQEFVRDLVTNTASQHVVHAVVALARGFGQKTVAEGVESTAALRLLAQMGVDYAQGYAIGRPRPVKAVFRTATITKDAA